MKQRPETSSAWTVIELVSMNCIADQPSSSPSPNRSCASAPWACIAMARISAGTNMRMLSGFSSRWSAQPCRSIAASMPQGA